LSRDLRLPHAFPTRRSSDLSGSMMNVPLCASPCSSSKTSNIRESFCDGSPIIIYCNLLIAAEWSCHALCVKCVSVETEYTSQPRSEEHTSELQSRENLVCRL